MDTPQRSQIAGAPLSNSEDSPVFSFINSLSPIQPVKSVHSVHAYTSPGFTSISSIFSSPHVNLQKESRILIKHSYSDTEKQENSSEIGDGNNLCAGVSNAVKLSSCITVTQENCNLKCSLNEATIDPPEENCKVKCSLDEPQLHPVQYDYGSPNHNITPCYGVKLDLQLGIGSTQVEVVQFAQDGLHGRKSLFAAEVHENHLLEQTKEEVAGCDHEHLVSIEADNLLLLDDSAASEAWADQKEKLGNENANSLTLANMDHHENLEYKDENSHATFTLNLTESVFNDSQKTELDASFGPCIESTIQDATVTHCGVVGRQDGTNHTQHPFAANSQNQTVRINQSQSTCSGINDCVSLNSKVERGFRRRCLVFEVSGASKRNLQDVRNQHLLETLPSKGKLISDNKHLASLKPGANPPPCVLPGIGLHLNTLASVSKDGVVTHENLTSGKRLISMPCYVGPFPLKTAEEESPNNSLSDEHGLEPIVSEVQDLQIVHDDVAQAPELGSGEEFSGSNPKKKRHKTEGTKENEGCKRCNCKKSKCLKLYCECFAAGMYCVELCSCQGCCNKPIHVEMVLATRKQIECRNPMAFAPKVIHASDTIQKMGEESNKTPASARHKRGCNCKKSSCLKKYCECYQGGVGCSFSCRCEGCKNAFGRKDGVMLMRAEELEHGEEGNSACENEESKSYEDEGQEATDIIKYEHQLSEHSSLATPDQTCRTSIKLPFLSSRKPPIFSKFSVGPSPLLSTCRTLGKPENTLPECKSGVCFETVTTENSNPEVPTGNSSQPINCLKTGSPNSKRVSPPRYGINQSPSRKGCRKLILKSIPSFPALVSSEYQVSHSNCSSSSSSLS